MNEMLIPLFAIFFIFGLPVAAFIVSRLLKHRERMELLRRGIIPPADMGDKRAYRAWQQSGAWQGPPPPPNVAPMPAPVWSAPEDDPQRALYRGIRVAFIGFAILLGLSFIGGTPGTSAFRTGPWLLGGLIPMFVGIAQVIIALLSGAELPGVQSRKGFGPPRGPGGLGSAPPPGFGPTVAPPPPPWAEQPGHPRFEELTKPAPPPDLR